MFFFYMELSILANEYTQANLLLCTPKLNLLSIHAEGHGRQIVVFGLHLSFNDDIISDGKPIQRL